jgi:hypothetical protein
MNETDLDLERLYRSHFRNARETAVAPSTLRIDVLAIPATIHVPANRWWANRRGLTLLAATVAIGAAALGWVALGGGRPPSPAPSQPAVLVDASPTTRPQGSQAPNPDASAAPTAAPVVVPPSAVQGGVTAGWVPAGTMAHARSLATATVLRDDRVLVVGGYSSDPAGNAHGLATAEVWDPATRTFSPAGALARPRIGHAAALLNDGRVLIVGGEDERIGTGARLPAEVWDPATGTFDEVGSMPPLPSGITATTLADGRVLIVGRETCLVAVKTDGAGRFPNCPGDSAAAFLWDPSGTWDVGPNPQEPRDWHTATLLPDGRVFLAGNQSWSADSPASAEVYDPAERVHPGGCTARLHRRRPVGHAPVRRTRPAHRRRYRQRDRPALRGPAPDRGDLGSCDGPVQPGRHHGCRATRPCRRPTPGRASPRRGRQHGPDVDLPRPRD